MASNVPDEDEELEVVATGDGYVDQSLAEDPLFKSSTVEVTYLTVTEDIFISEIENIPTAEAEDEGSSQGWEVQEYASEPEESSLHAQEEEEGVPDEEHIAVTTDYLAGKISFQDFIQRVEVANEDSLLEEAFESADEGDKEPPSSKKDDPDYVPDAKKLSKKGVLSSDDEDSSDSDETYKKTTTPPAVSAPSTVSKRPGRRKTHARRRPTKKLPSNLLGLMGEANLRYSRGEKEDAINLCMEVIRQAPNFPEPFQCLSMIYEGMEQYEKAYQLSLIAAYLSPQEADEWLRLHELCLSRNDKVQAGKCLAQAVQADPSNEEIHRMRIDYLENTGADMELVNARLAMLRGVQPKDEDKSQWVDFAVQLARTQHALGHLHYARLALSNALVHCSDHFTMGNYNLLLDLLILTKQYFLVIKTLNKYCGLVLDNRVVDALDFRESREMTLTKELPIDIRSKLCIALIFSDRMDFALQLIPDLLSADVEDFGDVYLDVAEALKDKKHYEHALVFLERLIASSNHNFAVVWLMYANTLVNIPGRLEHAVPAFQRVIQLAPSNPEARLSLAEILTELGRFEEAVEAVTQDPESTTIEPKVLHHRCILLLKEERWEPFIQTYKLLMLKHARNIKSKDEIYRACGAKPKGMGSDGEDESDEEDLEFGMTSVDIEEEFRLFRLAAEHLFNEKRLVELERLCFTALTSPVLRRKKELHHEVHFVTLQTCLAKGDSFLAYNLARSLLLRGDNMTKNRVWNIMVHVIMRGDDVRYNRFLMRLLVKNPDNIALCVLNGHACVASGTYKYALDEYLYACKTEPGNPFFLLLAAVVFVQLTCQKFSSGKHSLVTQATSFFDSYLRIRGKCQESYYNIGRGMHQLGLLPQAIEFYKKALDCKPSVTKGKYARSFDLCREIAFNLSLIYRAVDPTGLNIDVARMYIDKYIHI